MNKDAVPERIAVTWSPEARADLRAIDRQAAIQILHCIDRYLSRSLSACSVRPGNLAGELGSELCRTHLSHHRHVLQRHAPARGLIVAPRGRKPADSGTQRVLLGQERQPDKGGVLFGSRHCRAGRDRRSVAQRHPG